MANIDTWHFSFNVLKVNRERYEKQDEMVQARREEISHLIKEGAEKLADKFDFPYVAITARSTSTGETFNYTFQSDDGYRDDWQVGRQ